MTREERRALKLRQWAMRAADKINGVKPARAPHLGEQCDFAAEFLGHRCRCGERPMRWADVYGSVMEIMKREGVA